MIQKLFLLLLIASHAVTSVSAQKRIGKETPEQKEKRMAWWSGSAIF